MTEDDVRKALVRAARESDDLARRAEVAAQEAEVLASGIWRSDYERLGAAAKAASLRVDADTARRDAAARAADLVSYDRAQGIKRADVERVLNGLTTIEVDAEGVAKINYSTVSPQDQEHVRQQAAARRQRKGW